MTADTHHGDLQPCSAEGALGNFAKGLRSLRPIVSNAAQSRRERCRRSSLEERPTIDFTTLHCRLPSSRTSQTVVFSGISRRRINLRQSTSRAQSWRLPVEGVNFLRAGVT